MGCAPCVCRITPFRGFEAHILILFGIVERDVIIIINPLKKFLLKLFEDCIIVDIPIAICSGVDSGFFDAFGRFYPFTCKCGRADKLIW